MSNMKKDKLIEGSVENWENGVLGSDEAFVKIAESATSLGIDEMLELQMISIRLQKGMIKDLKSIAKYHGLGGYQPLIRRVLERFMIAEMKSIARDSLSEKNMEDENKIDEVSYSDDKMSMCG
tara:strand:- start:478 stop:846 length:369 start_codon:yes stop_codon:yes gene_type:complete